MRPSSPDRSIIGNSVSAPVVERVSSSLTQNGPYVPGASMPKSSLGSTQETGVGLEASAGTLSDGLLSEKNMYIPSEVSSPPIQSTPPPIQATTHHSRTSSSTSTLSGPSPTALLGAARESVGGDGLGTSIPPTLLARRPGSHEDVIR